MKRWIAALLCLTPRGKAVHAAGLALAAAVLTCARPARADAPVVQPPPETPPPLVQIAILLDTSGSMEGLINQARSQLWKIVNEFVKARQNGRLPRVEVALFEYGQSTLTASSGWIRQVLPLTTDLDRISEELFALKTNGGDEYCGQVIQEATVKLAWNPAPEVYKAIFIAGNEPFTQGSVNYAASCRAAIAKGIIVNTIHCGGEADGISGKWQDGAALADGRFMTINQNQAVAHIEAPQDAEIARLSAQLNQTYLAFGVEGRKAAARQQAQDANAVALAASGTVVSRALAKSSAHYRNESWDLVDAAKAKTVKLEELKAEELPAEMRDLPPQARQDLLEAKAKERSELQVKIQTLNTERAKFVAEKEKASAVTNTLDAVVITTVREQAAKKQFQFE